MLSVSPIGFAGRLRGRGRRGAALLDAFLALAVFAALATAVVLWIDKQRQRDLEEEAGRQVAILGHAAAHYALTHYAGAPGTFWTGARLNYTDLQTRGILPAGFPETDAMRRELKIWHRSAPGWPLHDRIQILAGQADFEPDDDTRIPLRGLFASRGKVRLGLVRRSGCPPGLTAPCLVGPTVTASLTNPFDHSFIDHGGLMAFVEVTREEYCGDVVLRQASATCPDSSDLGTLDMGENDVQNVGNMTVGTAGADGYTHHVDVNNDMQVTGNMTVDVSGRGGLVVDKTVDVRNTLTVSGGLAIYGNVEADNDLAVTADFRIRGNLDVANTARATNVRSRTMNVLETATENLNVDRLFVNSCPNCVK